MLVGHTCPSKLRILDHAGGEAALGFSGAGAHRFGLVGFHLTEVWSKAKPGVCFSEGPKAWGQTAKRIFRLSHSAENKKLLSGRPQ